MLLLAKYFDESNLRILQRENDGLSKSLKNNKNNFEIDQNYFNTTHYFDCWLQSFRENVSRDSEFVYPQLVTLILETVYLFLLVSLSHHHTLSKSRTRICIPVIK